MWIKNLDIETFPYGIEDGTELEFSPGVVVIAGQNEAGKTTFMNILRNLGYGFSESDFPYTDHEVQIRGTLSHNDIPYPFRIRDLDTPFLEASESATDPDVSISDLFGELSSYEFHQLFTISLDELKDRSEEAGEEEGEVDLETVLLGAGWSEISRIPQIREGIRERYEAMKSQGDPVETYLKELKSARDRRRRGSQDVVEYFQIRHRIDDLEEELTSKQKHLDSTQTERNRLEVIRNHFDRIQQYRSLNSTLEEVRNQEILSVDFSWTPEEGMRRQEEFTDLLQEIQEKRTEIRERTGTEDVESFHERLFDRASEIETFKNESSGIVERCKNLSESRKQYDEREARFLDRVRNLYDEWGNRPEALENLSSDSDLKERFEQAIEQYHELNRTLVELEQTRNEFQNELDDLKASLREVPNVSYRMRIAFGILSSLVMVGGGLYLSFFLKDAPYNEWIGGGVLGTGFFWALYYMGFRVSEAFQFHQERNNVKDEIRETEQNLEEVVEELNLTRDDMEDVKKEIQERRRDIGLPEEIEIPELKPFYRNALQLKEEREELKQEKERIDQKQEDVLEQLSSIRSTIDFITDEGIDFDGETGENNQTYAEELSEEIHGLGRELEAAEELHTLQDRKKRQKEQIQKHLEEVESLLDHGSGTLSDKQVEKALQQYISLGKESLDLSDKKSEFERIHGELQRVVELEGHKELFEGSGAPEEALSQFFDYASRYSSQEEVDQALENSESELEERRNEIQQLQEEIGQKKKQLDMLRDDDRFLDVAKKIRRIRNSLEPVARRNIIHQFAEIMLEKLYRKYIDKAFGPLLERASSFFNQITGDRYERIDPSMDLKESLYRAKSEEDEEKQPEILSRGTREQLFLSVRLARILDIEPSLPVILDDTAANFDPARRQWVSELLNDLGQSHQTFLLTCHPEMVEIIDSTVRNVQYWSLDDGQFDGPHEKPHRLIQTLQQGVE